MEALRESNRKDELGLLGPLSLSSSDLSAAVKLSPARMSLLG